MPPSKNFSLERVAELARIAINDAEKPILQKELEQVLDFFEVLEELDLGKVEPFFGMTPSTNDTHQPMRDDETVDSFDRETILKNAPESDGEFYHVPPVFE